MIRSLDHLDLVVGSLERSIPFYRDLLGLTESGEIEGERGERVVYLRPEGAARSSFALGLREQQAGHGAPVDRYALGAHHVAFELGSREEVDERAAWKRAHGAEIESGPAEYGYREGYYAVFFYDPDGIKLELLHVPEA